MDKLRGFFGPWLVVTDKVECSFCKKQHSISDLIPEKSQPILKSDGTGVWLPIYYFCSCDPIHPLVHDEGKGDLQLISRNAILLPREF